MPVIASDKPLDLLREETIDLLVMNYGHGQLSLAAFERRLDSALAATSYEELTSLTEDLELAVDKAFAEEKRRRLGVLPSGRDAEDVGYMVHVFSGTEKTGAWKVPAEIRMINIFGGAELDFTDARLTSPITRIRMFTLFGGAEIYVPEGMNTESKALYIFGGMEDKAPYHDHPDAPRLVIEGIVLFGGVSVAIRKTFKERLLELADTVRSMFGVAH